MTDKPPHGPCISQSEVLHTIPRHKVATQPYLFIDDDWGGDRFHRQAVTGLMVMLAGGLISYITTKFQSAVILSSVKA